MAGLLQKKHRSIIPRWRLFTTTASLGELDAIGQRRTNPFGLSALRETLGEWHAERTVWHAADALSTAFVLGRPELAQEPARFILEHGESSTIATIDLAQRVLGVEVERRHEAREHDWHDLVNTRRGSLRHSPRDATRWTDLALAHTVCGNRDASLRCIRIALRLAHNNRFVLRSAVRCFIHWGDIDYAHALLKSAAGTPYDPWLLAAEVATASSKGQASTLAGRAKRLLDDASIAPRALSELATAVGSLELEHGSRRSAARFFEQALLEPTENSVAQIEWELSEKAKITVAAVTKVDVPLLFEAKAHERYNAGDWAEAVQYAHEWYNDQPFSSRPTDLAAYAAALLGQYERALEYLEISRRSNPDDVMVINNQTYFEVLQGNIENAVKLFRETKHFTIEGDDALILQATAGLLEFRQGNIEYGRQLYQKTISQAWRKERIRAIATVNLAREELIVGNVETGIQLLMEGQRLARRSENDMELQAEVAAVERFFERKSGMVSAGK